MQAEVLYYSCHWRNVSLVALGRSPDGFKVTSLHLSHSNGLLSEHCLYIMAGKSVREEFWLLPDLASTAARLGKGGREAPKSRVTAHGLEIMWKRQPLLELNGTETRKTDKNSKSKEKS